MEREQKRSEENGESGEHKGRADLVRREQRVERVRGWREKREVRGKSRRRRDGGR